MKDKIKKILGILLLLIVTILVLYFSLKDNYEAIIHEMIYINKIWLLVAFILVFGYWILKSIVIQNITNKINKKFSFKQAFQLILETNFFHAITPFATGGQPYQIYYLKKSDIRLSDASNIVIQNFIIYQIALVLLGTIAVLSNFFLNLFPDNSLLKSLVIIGFLCNLVVIIGLFVLTSAKKINQIIMNFIIKFLSKIKIVKDKDATIKRFQKSLDDFHSGKKILLQDKWNFIKLILIDFFALSCQYAIPLALSFGIGDYTSMNLFTTLVASSYVMLIGSFVPIPGGTGGLEYGFMVFFGYFIPSSPLAAIMLLWRFITYYFALILGAIILNVRKKKKV